jgi:outer membrane receptor protein involved in Fe transport
MPKKLLLILLAFIFNLINLSTKAQNKIKIFVVDSISMNKLAGALVMVTFQDGDQIKSLTDKSGVAELKLVKSAIEITGTFIGYQKKALKIKPEDRPTEITLQLKEEVNILKAVSITEKPTTISATPEGYNYNIDKSVRDINVNASQLLKKLPGIVPQQDGQLKIMGKSITITIDGKPSLLSGAELEQYLQSLNLNDVKQLKVQVNPSAAFGTAGAIIDIVSNVPLLDGIQVRIDSRLETHDKYGIGATADYKVDKYSGKYTINYRHNNLFNRNSYEQQNILSNGERSNYDYHSNSEENPTSNVNISLINNFAVNKTNTLGLVLKYSGFDAYDAYTQSRLGITNESAALIGTNSLFRNDQSNSNVFYGDFNYRSILNKKGSSLTFDTYYWKRDAFNHFSVGQKNLVLPANSLSLDSIQNNSDQDLSIKSIAVNLNHPLNKFIALTAGLSATGFLINGDFGNQNFDFLNGRFYQDLPNTYLLNYNEDVYSAFLNFSGRYKKLTYSVGFRAEQTDLKLESLRQNSSTLNKSNFFNPLPNVGFVYALNDKSNLTLAYSKKIWRVSYSQLNPIDFSTDPTTVRRGNPDLRPSTTDSYGVSYAINTAKKNNYIISFSYARENNPYTWLNIKGEQVGTYINQPFNYEADNRFNISVFTQQNITKKVGFTLNLKGSRNFMNVGIFDIPDPEPINAFGGSFSLNYKLWKNAVVEIFGVAQSKSVTPQGSQGNFHFIDLALSKSFLKDALSLNLTANDIFNTNRYNYENYADFFVNSGYRKTETQILRFSVSYKFGKTKENSIKSYTPKEDDRFGQ